MNEITALIDTNLAASPIQAFPSQLELARAPQAQDPENPFSMFFGAALGMVNDANRFQYEANQMQLDFATGRIDDILAVQMSMSRAADSLTFTSQVTNRIIEAYREIMRMQI